MITYSSRCSR